MCNWSWEQTKTTGAGGVGDKNIWRNKKWIKLNKFVDNKKVSNHQEGEIQKKLHQGQ